MGGEGGVQQAPPGQSLGWKGENSRRGRHIFLFWVVERWWWRGVKVWCERSRLGMRTRGYQLVRGSLCPISGVRGRVPRVETPVTSLASSLPGGLGDQGYLLLPPSPPPYPSPDLPTSKNKTAPPPTPTPTSDSHPRPVPDPLPGRPVCSPVWMLFVLRVAAAEALGSCR